MVKKAFLFFFIVFVIISIFLYDYFSKVNNNDHIVLGASLPLSGINKELGSQVIEGANTYFSHVNARGGINGRFINLLYYDDKYEPENTLINTKFLIRKDKVFSLFGFVGTPTTKKILPIVYNEDIPLIAPFTGASFLRNNEIKSIVNFRSSYKEEVEAIINYLYTYKDLTKFAIFYQNDDYGEEGYIATIEALQKRDLNLVSEGTYKRNTLSIRHALHEIQTIKPEAIIIIGAYKASAQFIKKARECCFDDVIFAPISFVNANALMDELQGDGTNILFSQTVPSYHEDLVIAEEYLKLLKFYYPTSEPSYASFESFLAAKLVVMALKDINGNITPRKFLRKLKRLPTDVLGEIPIEYKNTQLLNKVYLSTYKDSKFQLVSKIK